MFVDRRGGIETITRVVAQRNNRALAAKKSLISNSDDKSTRSMTVWVDVDIVNHISTKKATLSDCFLFKALGYVM
jgi:hypothetical protein